ncbi:MAG: hypothetical protein RKK11_18340 [Alphaproteobacteria bacterium]
MPDTQQNEPTEDKSLSKSGTRHVKSVAIQVSAYHLPMNLALAAMFKKHHGAKVYIYCNSPEEKRGLERRYMKGGTFDAVFVSQHLNPALTTPVDDPDTVLRRGREWEEKIGETFGRLIFEHRPMARGYFSGAQANPRMPLVEQADYVQMVNGIVNSLDFWKQEIEDKKIDLVIEGDKIALAVCRLLGTAYRRVFLSKFDGEHFWACDEKLSNPRFKEIYDGLTEWPEVKLQVTQPSQVYKVNKGTIKFRWRWVLGHLLTNLTKNVLLAMFGSHRGRYSIKDLLTTPFVARNNYMRYRKLINTTLEDLRGTKFVYFPLHKEPETNMLSASPDYFNQIAAISSLSRDLPVGVPLVLKEHVPAFGLRGPTFYRDLMDLKNVKLIAHDESSIEIIKESAATVTISGSAGLEASVVGKPAIQFGRFMLNRFLPHVMTVTDDRDIAGFLRRAIEGDFDLEQARKDGARFREALRQGSFTMGEFMVEDQEFSEASAQDAFDALMKSLDEIPAVGGVAPNYYQPAAAN